LSVIQNTSQQFATFFCVTVWMKLALFTKLVVLTTKWQAKYHRTR